MSLVRLRRRVVDRLSEDFKAAGELGLALLITAGVVGCGGEVLGNGSSSDAGDAPGSEGSFGDVTFEAAEAGPLDGPVGDAGEPDSPIVVEAAVDAGPPDALDDLVVVESPPSPKF
jgi:hypothetical protein